jgi:hypothetical protein
MGRGLGTVTPPITELTPDQQNQTTALAAVAWALLDAESRNDRAGALSLIPVFKSSYNAWSSGVRRIYTAAPASLSPTSGWGTPEDTALTLTIATYAWMQQRTDAQIHALLGSWPTGAVPNAYRGTYFMTQIAPQFGAPVFDHAVAAFRARGADGMLDFSDAVSRGSDPGTAATPAPPARTLPSAPAPHTSSVVLPDMTITASSPVAQSITWPWYALGGAVAIGIGVFAYQRIKRGSK